MVESRVPLRIKESDNAQILFRKGLAAYLHISQAVSPRFFKCLKVIYFMYFACTHVCVPRGCWVPGAQRGQQRAFADPGTRITDGYEAPCRGWVLNRDPLQD